MIDEKEEKGPINKKKPSSAFDPNTCYEKARKSCKCGCLVNHQNCYVIPNNIWALNQRKLMKTRENNSDLEIDKLMKETLYHKMLEKQIKTVKDHVRLEFQVTFDTDDFLSSKKNHNLCESCYVVFNNHRCKWFVFMSSIY